MSRNAVEEQFKSKLLQVGKAGMNALFPNDFPYYLVALELVDSQNNTVDYFSFPILPDEIRETQQEITNVKKTMSAISVQKNQTFVPIQISMRGDFGRRFKILLGNQQVQFAGFGLSIKNKVVSISSPGSLQEIVPQFSSFAKTGYGCVKLIEAMKEKSKKLDNYQKPFSLYLYNPILGNNYQVEFNTFTHMQDREKYNMIPAYNFQLTAIAPLNNLFSRGANLKSAIGNLTLSGLQKAANNIGNRLRLTPKLS